MFNYSGCVYVLFNKSSNAVYIGSTRDTIERRMKQHLLAYQNYLIGSHKYYTAMDVFCNGIDCVSIEIVYVFTDEDKKQRLEKEQEAINEFRELGYDVKNKNSAYNSHMYEYQKKYRDFYIENPGLRLKELM